MLKVIIAGGRDFDDYVLLNQSCNEMLGDEENVEIVSGIARGADKLGEKYANEKGFLIKQFPADWDGLGKKAGFVRNEKMAKYADVLIAFWDGKSKGTKHMIDLAIRHNLKVMVVRYY